MCGIRLGGVAALLALALTATTSGATDWCGDPPVVDVGGAAYVAWDCMMCHCCLLSQYVYVEANGEHGLQRGGASVLLGDLDVDACQTTTNPDMLVW